jgi:hypothetical protein
MDRAYGQAGRFMGKPAVGGGEKTGPVAPAPDKGGIPEQMPQGIGGSAVKTAPGKVFALRGGFGIHKAVIVPAKKLKALIRRGNPFKHLYQINTYPRPAAGGGKGIYADFHGLKYTSVPVNRKGPEYQRIINHEGE